MEKADIDELYHLLREVSNTAEELSPLPAMVYGLTKHLMAGGDYLRLIQFLEYYGASYLVEPVVQALGIAEWKFDRVVELGAGLGWLGRRISMKYNNCPTFFIDKRPWTMINLVADVETEEGLLKVLRALKPNDLIVMSEFVHCLEDPIPILSNFAGWPKLIIEYQSMDKRHMASYMKQIQRFGAKPVELASLVSLADKSESVTLVEAEPHVIVLIPAIPIGV